MNNVLVIGADGQLGSEINTLVNEGFFKEKAFKEKEAEQTTSFFFTDVKDLDITDYAEIEHYLNANNINTIINCAAYTAVDKAESDEEKANAINHYAVENLAILAKKHAVGLIHVSTDYVFDGKNYKPYKTTDTPNPQSVYGRSKLAGEQAVLAVAPKQSCIIRTAWVYSSFGANFVKTMLKLGSERDALNVVYDQIGSPTYARDLAKAILHIIKTGQLDARESVKTYHYTNEGVTSWYDFAKEIMAQGGVDCDISPIEGKDYPTPAQRPHYSVLDKSEIKADFDVVIPHWKEALKECIGKLEE